MKETGIDSLVVRKKREVFLGFLFSVLILSLWSFSACVSQLNNGKRYFCDYLGVPLMDEGNHSNTLFDRVFSYKKSSEGWTAVFVESGGFMPAKLKKEFLYGDVSAGQVGSDAVDWEVFDVYRFNMETEKLTKSVVYYTPKEDYERNLQGRQNNPYIIPYSQKPLEFMDKEAPENYVKYGFDKSEWKCREVSSVKYLFHLISLELLRVLAI